MMLASIYGRLGKDPRSIDTAKSPMCVSSVAVDLVDRNSETTTQWFGLVAFGKVADILAKHSKGEWIAASGRVQPNSWTNNDGETQTELQLIADSIISAHAARPSGKRKEKGTPEQADLNGEADHSDQQDFDDDIPF